MSLETSSRSEPPWRRPAGRIIVVLPAFNEELGLGSLLERIDQVMYEDQASYEVILVDDGSTDGTVAVAEEHARHMPIRIQRHPKNRGLGATIRDGLHGALAICQDKDTIVVMDADNTHTPGLIRTMARMIKEGNDVVIASRYQPGSRVLGVPWHRRLLSAGASLLFRLCFPIPGVKDYTCGYRAYRAELLGLAFERYGEEFVSEDGFQCMVDILLKLRTMGAIVGEAPLVLRYDLKEGASKMNVLSTTRRTLALLLRRRFRS